MTKSLPLPPALPIAEILAPYVKPCWRPRLGAAGSDRPGVNRIGGDKAMIALGASWPRHDDDNEPLALILQLYTDTLPAESRAMFGGAGQVFQLFLPLDAEGEDPRSFEFDDEGNAGFVFEVRVTPTSTPMVERSMPDFTDPEIDMPRLKPFDILGWEEASDLPFLGDGELPAPHAFSKKDEKRINAEVDRAVAEHGEEAAAEMLFGSRDADVYDWSEGLCEWGFKIGGHPALEQGPQVPHDFQHILQISGDGMGPTGTEVASDGHGWLCRTPEGEWFWYSVTS